MMLQCARCHALALDTTTGYCGSCGVSITQVPQRSTHTIVHYCDRTCVPRYPPGTQGSYECNYCLKPFIDNPLTGLLPAMSADYTGQKLFDFYFNTDAINKPKEPVFNKDECKSHDWVEVILFHTPQLRCRWCDIKKSSSL